MAPVRFTRIFWIRRALKLHEMISMHEIEGLNSTKGIFTRINLDKFANNNIDTSITNFKILTQQVNKQMRHIQTTSQMQYCFIYYLVLREARNICVNLSLLIISTDDYGKLLYQHRFLKIAGSAWSRQLLLLLTFTLHTVDQNNFENQSTLIHRAILFSALWI